MKTSTMFVLLTLGAVSLNGAVILPASADDNTPTTKRYRQLLDRSGSGAQ